MRGFSELHGLKYQHFNDNKTKFIEELSWSEFDVLSLNNKNIELDNIGEYRGSHFVRDPRDLVISGYFYHKWCPEHWCRKKEFPWWRYTGDLLFDACVSGGVREPQGISYQNYLNTLSLEQGLVLEMIWRKEQFRNMAGWDYENPHILEVKYECIIDNEPAAFERIYDHYALNPAWKHNWMNLADKFSRKNMKLGGKVHVRDGRARQWEQIFTPELKQVFKSRYGELLIRLGYEQDLSW